MKERVYKYIGEGTHPWDVWEKEQLEIRGLVSKRIWVEVRTAKDENLKIDISNKQRGFKYKQQTLDCKNCFLYIDPQQASKWTESVSKRWNIVGRQDIEGLCAFGGLADGYKILRKAGVRTSHCKAGSFFTRLKRAKELREEGVLITPISVEIVSG